MGLLIRLTLGLVCAMVGVAGLLLPVLPGWIFLAAAALLLFPEARFTRKAAERMEHHFPSLAGVLRLLSGRPKTPAADRHDEPAEP